MNTFNNNTVSAFVANDTIVSETIINKELSMNPTAVVIPNNNNIPSITVELLGRKVTFIGGTSMWKVNITGTTGNTIAPFKGMDACKTILNALTHIYLNTYQTAEIGLYVKKSMDELQMLGIADNVGYVRNGTYAGSLVDGLETLSKYQVGIVSWRYGRFVVVRALNIGAFEVGEPEEWGHLRNAQNLVMALDLIYRGDHLILEPIARTTSKNITDPNTGEVTVEYTSGRTHVNMMLMTYMSNLTHDQDTSRSNVRAAVQKKETRVAFARAINTQKTVEAAGKTYSANMTQVDVIVDLATFKTERVNLADLSSTMVALYKGRQLVQAFADLSNEATLAVIRNRTLCVVLLEN